MHLEADVVAQTPDLVEARAATRAGTAAIADLVSVDGTELDLGANRAVAHGAAVTHVHQAALSADRRAVRLTTTG